MSSNVISGRPIAPGTCPLSLELEVEICAAGRCDVTAERLRALAALLNDAEGVSLATAEAHGQARLIRVRLTVEAYDLYDALDRVSALVRDCASRAALGPAILVAAAASAPRRATSRRMA